MDLALNLDQVPTPNNRLLLPYLTAALVWGRCRQAGEFPDGDAAARVIERLGRVLRASPEGCGLLAALLEAPDPHVRLCAARDCLPSHTLHALAVLDELAAEKGYLGAAALAAIAVWQAGHRWPQVWH